MYFKYFFDFGSVSNHFMTEMVNDLRYTYCIIVWSISIEQQFDYDTFECIFDAASDYFGSGSYYHTWICLDPDLHLFMRSTLDLSNIPATLNEYSVYLYVM